MSGERPEYQDRRVSCTGEAVVMGQYYFPAGRKKVPFSRIRAVSEVGVGVLTGKWRIWGSGNLRYWASFDPGRPRKNTAFILDTGRFVRPFVTPDDPAGFRACLERHGLSVASGRRRVI
jgi:hypothetical protein